MTSNNILDVNIMIPDKIIKIMQQLCDNGYDAYVVGGAVRDILIGEEPHDWDIFTDACGEEILTIFPTGKVIGGVERQEKILTVIVDGVEISQYRKNGDRTEVGNSFSGHLATCDFTINSMAMDINCDIIDIYNGNSDIDCKMICCVGNAKDRIDEDPLRAFRAIRFSMKYDFEIHEDLYNIIRDMDVTRIPIERIREEILKIIRYPGGLMALENSGLLEKVIPEYSRCCRLNGGKHHDEYVNNHMGYAQDLACGLSDNPAFIFACALHDLGKGVSFQIKDDGDISFHQHEHVGAGMVRDIMNRMKFSKDDVKYVETLINEHMFAWNTDGMSDKAFVRHFGRMERAGISIEDFVMMMYCDSQGNMGNERVKFGDFINGNNLVTKYYSLKYSTFPFSVTDLRINGHDVMECGVVPGPDIGRVLNDVFERVLNGELENERAVLMNHVRSVGGGVGA